jgi:4-hydroxy-tetrahydrodipicolinate reductase
VTTVTVRTPRAPACWHRAGVAGIVPLSSRWSLFHAIRLAALPPQSNSEDQVRIGVVGAGGRMGTEVCRAAAASDGLDLVAAVDPGAVGRSLNDVAGVDGAAGEVVITDDLGSLTAADVEVAVEFTGPATVGDHLVWLLEHGVHAVVGATGLREEDLARARAAAAGSGANALIAPNFAIGAVLLMRFAAEAARHLPHVEVVELHHDRKVDAPSGTALRTAELISKARSEVPADVAGDEHHLGARGVRHADVRVHSIRLPGLVAHQEVIFGGEGQTLTLRHDSLDRSSFMPGVLLACRRVHELDGVVIGLDPLL